MLKESKQTRGDERRKKTSISEERENYSKLNCIAETLEKGETRGLSQS